MAQEIQHATGAGVKLAFEGKGYTDKDLAEAALEGRIELRLVELQEAKNGFVLLSCRWQWNKASTGSTI